MNTFILISITIVIITQYWIIRKTKEIDKIIYDLKVVYQKELMRFTGILNCDRLPEQFISNMFNYPWAEDPLNLVVYLYLVGRFFQAESEIKYNHIEIIDIKTSLEEISEKINVMKPFVLEGLMCLIKHGVIEIRPSGEDNNTFFVSMRFDFLKGGEV